jgi:hypothetical protein
VENIVWGTIDTYIYIHKNITAIIDTETASVVAAIAATELNRKFNIAQH